MFCTNNPNSEPELKPHEMCSKPRATHLGAGAAVVAQPREADADNQHHERHTDDDNQHGGVRRLVACKGDNTSISICWISGQRTESQLTLHGEHAGALVRFLDAVRVDHRVGEHAGVWAEVMRVLDWGNVATVLKLTIDT